jgi:hypothetical protein
MRFLWETMMYTMMMTTTTVMVMTMEISYDGSSVPRVSMLLVIRMHSLLTIVNHI